jgi:phage/conjugal plasmid C-4 type zinc finger TraR family protein
MANWLRTHRPLSRRRMEVSEMAGGWARDGAEQEQIDATIDDAIRQARSQLPAAGPGLTHCEECDAPIPVARREAIPGVRRCVGCQQALDAGTRPTAGFNRRGSKDSQLR